MAKNFFKESAKIRADFVRLVLEQDDEINSELDGLISDFDRAVGSGSFIRNPEKIDSLAQVYVTGFTESLSDIMKKYNKDTAEVVADGQLEKMIKYVIAAGVGISLLNTFRQAVRKIPSDVEKGLMTRTMPLSRNTLGTIDRLTIGQRIMSVKSSAVKTVRNLVYTGVENGWSAKVLADKIAKYIDPRVSKMTRVAPWQLVRSRFDRPISYTPKDIRAGSVWANSMTIARSELNNTWRLVAVDLHKDKPWMKGWEWVLSSSHKVADICDEWARRSPYKDPRDLPVDHPNGLCHVEALVMNPNEFKKLYEAS